MLLFQSLYATGNVAAIEQEACESLMLRFVSDRVIDPIQVKIGPCFKFDEQIIDQRKIGTVVLKSIHSVSERSNGLDFKPSFNAEMNESRDAY